jgi:hypothetical protein
MNNYSMLRIIIYIHWIDDNWIMLVVTNIIQMILF